MNRSTCLCAAGDALFQTHENLEHLAMMEAVLGPLPEHMARAANRQAVKYFTPRCAFGRWRVLQHAHRLTLKTKCVERAQVILTACVAGGKAVMHKPAVAGEWGFVTVTMYARH